MLLTFKVQILCQFFVAYVIPKDQNKSYVQGLVSTFVSCEALMRMRRWHLAQHQAGGTPLVNCPRCVMQYTFSYPPYPRDLLHNLKPEEEPCHGDREPPTLQGHKEVLLTRIWYCVGYVAYEGNPIKEATK